eukprot:scaffold1137_cov55-Cyclotella_meneghiniana.AAC.6
MDTNTGEDEGAIVPVHEPSKVHASPQYLESPGLYDGLPQQAFTNGNEEQRYTTLFIVANSPELYEWPLIHSSGQPLLEDDQATVRPHLLCLKDEQRLRLSRW